MKSAVSAAALIAICSVACFVEPAPPIGNGATTSSGSTGPELSSSGLSSSSLSSSSLSSSGSSSSGPELSSGSSNASGEGPTGSDSTGQPIDPDLVLWLRLDERALTHDSSPLRNDGFCGASSCPAPGARGGAVFDGTNDVISVTYTAAYDLGVGFTVALWIRLDEMPEQSRAAFTMPLASGNLDSWELYFFPSFGLAPLFSFATSASDSVDVISNTAIELGVWAHLAATWDGQDAGLWVDGIRVATEPSSIPPLFEQNWILLGADDNNDAGGLGFYWPGALDDARVYSRALDASEIQALAAIHR